MSFAFTGKIGFIGGGNMAQALIGGLLAKGIQPSQILVSEPVAELRAQLAERDVTTLNDNHILMQQSDIILLAVKPQVMSSVLTDLADCPKSGLIISIAAGISTDMLSRLLGGYERIVRAMPNTPAMVQSGATGLYAMPTVNETDRHHAQQILAATGLVLWVDDENLMHAVTAVSGSGPAYFFYLMESMIQAGVELGLDEASARSLTLQTALGAAQIAITSSETPEKLRKNVTSPNGTTQAAIETMDQGHMQHLIAAAIHAAAGRSISLSQELDQANES